MNAQHTPEAERYLWLRDGRSRNGGWGGRAPFVMSPSRSRLYAIHALRAEALDAEIDNDIIENKVEELHLSGELVERGLLPAGSHVDCCDEVYCDALYALAQAELGWSDERADIAKATRSTS